MAVDERSRHQLHTSLETALGREEAATLMAHLPPVGWADVATRRDLDQLEARITTEIRAELHREVGALRGEIGELRGEFYQAIATQTRTIMVSMISTVIAATGLAFTAARLL